MTKFAIVSFKNRKDVAHVYLDPNGVWNQVGVDSNGDIIGSFTLGTLREYGTLNQIISNMMLREHVANVEYVTR